MRGGLVLILLAGIAGLATLHAGAQESVPDGRIAGTVVSGTAGIEPRDVVVHLIVLEDAQVTGDERAMVEEGAFEFTVPATARRTYVLSTRYQGIQYFAEPVILSPETPEASRELTVYETTRETPEMRIVETIVAVIAIDRGRGEVWLRREDFLSVPGDRVFIGDEAGITLRVPAPEATIEVDGGDLEAGVVSITTPLHPGEGSSIVTHYLVRYDPAQDTYRLRVTAPVLTERIEARVPVGYVHRVQPLEEARLGDEYTLPEMENVVMQTAVLETPSDPGRGMLVDLVGLSGTRITHPLSEQPGAGVAAGIALALIGGAAAVILRRRRMDAAAPAERRDA